MADEFALETQKDGEVLDASEYEALLSKSFKSVPEIARYLIDAATAVRKIKVRYLR